MSLTKNQLFNTIEQVKEYVDLKDLSITPHIDETTKHWFIGDTDTGISANGMEEEELTDEELNALITDTISSLNN